MPPDPQPIPVRQMLDQDLYNKLPAVAWWVAFVYSFLAVVNMAIPSELQTLVVCICVVIVGIMVLCRYLLRTGRVPVRHIHGFAVLAMGVPLLSEGLIQMALSGDAKDTVGILLLLMGMSYFFLDTRWMLLIIGYALIPWLLMAMRAEWSTEWVNHGVAFVAAVVGSLLIQTTNMKTLSRFYLLQTQELLQRTELQRRAGRLEAAVQIAQNINSTLDLPHMLEYVVQSLVSNYSSDNVCIMLFDEEKGELEYRAGTYHKGWDYRQSIQQGVMGWAMRHQKVVCVNNVAEDPRYIVTPYNPDTRSELTIPLRVRHKRLGVLDVQSSQVNAFHAEEIGYLTLLADQVAIAIGNAMLYQKEQQARQVSEALRQIGQELNSSLDLTKILDLVLGYVLELVHTARVSVILQREEGLQVMAVHGVPPDGHPLPHLVPNRFNSSGAFNILFESKRPLHIPDVSQWPNWQFRDNWPKAYTWLGVPIVEAGQTIGLFSLTRQEVRPFTAEEIDLALLLADQAAVALKNAQLYQKVVTFSEQMEEEVAKRTAEISHAYAELEQLDHAKESYIRILAHELRTPLTGLQNYTQLLARETAANPAPRTQRIVQGLQTGIQRLHQMAEMLNDVMRLDSGTLTLSPVIFAPHELLAEVVEQIQQQLASREQTAVLSPTLADLPSLTADYNLLTKLFHHLLSNAIKYTPNGGRITLHGQRRECPADGRDGVELCVEDTGIGIPPHLLETIFHKFYQTGDIALYSSHTTQFQGGGPGLGLPIAQGIAHAHGGKLWATSPGHDELTLPGSCFHLWLPLER